MESLASCELEEVDGSDDGGFCVAAGGFALIVKGRV